MKPIITALLLIITLLSAAQDTTKTYNFKEIGWTIKLPAGFKELTAAEDAAKNQRGKEMMEDVADAKMDISEMKTLFSATKNTHNYMNATITPFDPERDGDWDESVVAVKELLYRTFEEKMPQAKLDSVSSTVTIDGIKFDKFKVTVTIESKMAFNMFMLAKLYKGYNFGITYLCLDDKTQKDVEAVLNNSTFKK